MVAVRFDAALRLRLATRAHPRQKTARSCRRHSILWEAWWRSGRGQNHLGQSRPDWTAGRCCVSSGNEVANAASSQKSGYSRFCPGSVIACCAASISWLMPCSRQVWVKKSRPKRTPPPIPQPVIVGQAIRRSGDSLGRGIGRHQPRRQKLGQLQDLVALAVTPILGRGSRRSPQTQHERCWLATSLSTLVSQTWQFAEHLT